MKQAIRVLLLVLVILVGFFYSAFYISFNLRGPNNFVNNTFRKKFISSYLLRKTFKLNQVGDARFDYAKDKQFSKMKIGAYYQDGEQLTPGTIQTVIQNLGGIIEKPGGVIVEEPITIGGVGDAWDDESLRQLVQKHPGQSSLSEKTAALQIFVLSRYAVIPTYAGLVKDANNIFVFMEPVKDVSNEQRSTRNMEVSTILHEFAHLLGAEHVDKDDCILSEKVENITSFGLVPVITTKYCESDLETIKTACSF